MEARYGKADRVWCGDRGMMSKENIAFMESGGRRYIIGASKGTLKKFERGLFEVEVKQVAGRAVVSWTKNEKWRDWATLGEGCYLLRTNVTDWSAEDLWQAYIQLTEAEAAFRIHKSDLRIRPVWHQIEDRVLAHILVCFLAYVLWKTLH